MSKVLLDDAQKLRAILIAKLTDARKLVDDSPEIKALERRIKLVDKLREKALKR